MHAIIKRSRDIFLFLSGVLCVVLLFLLTGARTQNPAGRYEMEIGQRDSTHLIYVLDTTTGAVKWVDSMDTPFEELKGN